MNNASRRSEENSQSLLDEMMTIMLEDPDSRGSETKTNDVECQKTQEDQNQPRAVETGFHDGTTEQELQRLLTETIITISIVNGANSDQMSRQTNHTRICVVLDSDERDKFDQISEHTEERAERTEN